MHIPESFRKPRLPFLISLVIIGLVLVACSTYSYYEPDKRQARLDKQLVSGQTYAYQEHVQPILDRKCVACHSCNDAPCQLKLESAEGLERGASKRKVYDGTRISDSEPTRLGIDAHSVKEWRTKGFFSVLTPVDEGGHSILHKMITLGQASPLAAGASLPEQFIDDIGGDLACPGPDEIDTTLKRNPHLGMPYGVSRLTAEEFTILTTWLSEGAPLEATRVVLEKPLADAIAQWEALLNTADARHKLVARYLYEHLFLAHLYFADVELEQPRFFKLIRSYTPAPQTAEPVATVRPNGKPEQPFYYRLVPVTETIVHKTHIVYPLSEQRMARFEELFFDPPWQVGELPGYDATHASNPFLTFAAIPAKSRYQFMLDDAEYFTRTFIRGPVCRGQIATDVIRDQFWVMFEDPDSDQFVADAGYEKDVIPYLGLPGENSDLLALGPAWFKYKAKRNEYLGKRSEQYAKTFPEGARLEHIWDGDGHNRNAFLSIFRHHNSASVAKGWLGQYPQTLWVLDYPLFERTYYELVVGFNVFGSISHQAQTRLYFDLIRNGGEINFLRFLPPEAREATYDRWYEGLASLKKGITYRKLDTDNPTAIAFSADESEKLQLIKLLQRKHQAILPQDHLNQCSGARCAADNDNSRLSAVDLAMRRLSLEKPVSNPGILLLPEVTLIRVDTDNAFRFYSLLRNRAHTNVAFMLGESLRYQEEKDTTTILDWPISSYPNFMFRVQADELDSFVSALIKVDSEQSRKALIDRWGVRRSDAAFWDVFDSLVAHEDIYRPYQSSIFDLNRYRGW